MQVNIAGNLIHYHSRFTACSILAFDAIIISDLHPEHCYTKAIHTVQVVRDHETVMQPTHDAVQNADQLYIH